MASASVIKITCHLELVTCTAAVFNINIRLLLRFQKLISTVFESCEVHSVLHLRTEYHCGANIKTHPNYILYLCVEGKRYLLNN
jgi:hypothetical protein